jgi:hypothetical protein
MIDLCKREQDLRLEVIQTNGLIDDGQLVGIARMWMFNPLKGNLIMPDDLQPETLIRWLKAVELLWYHQMNMPTEELLICKLSME